MEWLEFENQGYADGFESICGIDEAGRGPLAGGVFAAAVILPKGMMIEGVNDSKKLSEKKREMLFDVICEQALDYAVGIATEQEIDEINILNATFLAMHRAYEGLEKQADLALIDGNQKPHLPIAQRMIVKGDARSMSIAAASILAKVSRDRYMLEMDRMYPEYQFARHKGYGTKLHYEMIEKYGVSPIHRKTFLKKILNHG